MFEWDEHKNQLNIRKHGVSFSEAAPDIGGKGKSVMNKDIEYTDAPEDIEESLARAAVVPNFGLTPEQVKEWADGRAKKPVSIYLSVETIEKFKSAAKKTGGHYQRMISDVLDTYTRQYL